jgi:2-polyprenyl-6-methoxyphenol hydroxylase-like FAD-dependent oxidoreductase
LSRPLLEATLAERVRVLPNVTILENARSKGFRSQGMRSVSGIRVHITRPSERFEEIPADLVVDATGRGSATPDHLRQMGFEELKAEWIRARVTYASCRFRRPAHWAKWRVLLVTGAPAKRTGFLLSIEDGQWLVSLASFFGEPAPRDHEQFLASARSLVVPDLYDAIRDREPLSDVVRYHFPGSLRRRYEALERPPEGLIVLGDAVCSFNPVYGQGITISAMQAEVLDRITARAKQDGGMDADFARQWFRSIGSDVNAAWNAISIEDLQFPELAHERPLLLRPLQWYMKRVHRATYRSQPVTDQFYQVVGFLAPPSTLFHPRIMADVLFGLTAGRHGRAVE